MKLHRKQFTTLALAALATGFLGSATAQSAYPSKTVTMVVPTAAGGTTDLFARMLAQALGPGAGPISGGGQQGRWQRQHCRQHRQARRGRWLHAAHAVLGLPRLSRPTSPSKSSGSRATSSRGQCHLGPADHRGAGRPAREDAARADCLRQGQPRASSTTPCRATARCSTSRVPCWSSRAPSRWCTCLTRASAPRCKTCRRPFDLTFLHASVQLHIASGKLRVLAVTGKQRLPSLPDVPTTTEAGYPKVDATSWFAVFTAGVPKAVVDKLYGGHPHRGAKPHLPAKGAGAGRHGRSPHAAPAGLNKVRADLASWADGGDKPRRSRRNKHQNGL